MTQRLILLIESDQSVRAVLKVCLHQIGKWDVISASSVQEALALLQTIVPDAILCDEPMSEMGDLIPLSAYAPSIPILLISVQASWFTAQQLQEMGMVSAIAKPFNPLILPTQIAQILNWSVQES